MGRPLGASVEEDMKLFDTRLKQLKLEYDMYFLGNRPTEPRMLRNEVQRIVVYWSNQPIRNTALRFRFNSLCARLFALRRHWDATVRKIEEGTYERVRFRDQQRGASAAASPGSGSRDGTAPSGGRTDAGSEPDLYQELREARRRCGQDIEALSREKFDSLLRRQERSLREQYGAQKVRFKVAVENGRAKLKARPVKDGGGG